MKCQIQNEDGERVCQNEAVWIHTYYATLSVCEEHFRKLAASNLGSITTEKKAAAVRENGKLGGRPKKDPLFDEAKRLVMTLGKVSTGLLQRGLNIGYTKSALLVDQLEQAGVIGPAEPRKPRKVLS